MTASAPSPEKIEQFRQQLKSDWTRDETVAAWRKWHKEIAAFTRGATEALLNEANIQPGQIVLDLASGVGDPALSIASKVGPFGRVIATDLGPDMMSLAAELAAGQNLHNIEFREAAAESLPFADATFNLVTCRFGAMFFPDLHKALVECRRVLKPGGKIVFIVWGVREQPFTTATVDVLLKYVTPPEQDPDAPSLFMFGVRGRFQNALQLAGFQSVKEEHLSVPARWPLPVEEYWTQFTEVSRPFRPLLAQLSPEKLAEVRAEALTGLQKYIQDGRITFPLQIVLASATRP
ncbi:MAG TPA: class I SAM-dependent methyltransferase [Candidatus Dormibacteraeota bacterium]|jgi:SAM-dependent methyltransferase|nr:class I SAM-dependent methyltransferase [Candidatus Dormibacteraeota bacterium]